jgi:large subunit ribosomal protein L1
MAEAKTKKVIFKWEEAYADLSDKVREALVNARVKPDQLAQMADGEILALEGVNDSMLEEIRGKYSADLAKDEVKEAPKAVEAAPEKAPVGDHPKLKRPRAVYGRSQIYKSKSTKVEDKVYSLSDAVDNLKKVKYSKHNTIELHINVREIGIRGEVALPFSVGKQIKVAIFTPELAEQVKAGKIDFDILLAHPKDMGAVAPLARILGPRGMMPNPKNGTVTENPEERAEKLQAGATLSYKTEAKAPLIHLVVGSLKQKDDEIIQNISAVLTALGASKIKSATLKSTMSPGIRVQL